MRNLAAVLALAGVLTGACWLGHKTYQSDDDDECFGPFPWIGAACLGALIGWGVGVLLGFMGKVFTSTDLGSFNGHYFRVRNKDFEPQFGELNPGWANPQTRKLRKSSPQARKL
jgi:hypothetical protein